MHGMTHSRQRNSSKLDVEGSSPFSRSTKPSDGQPASGAEVIQESGINFRPSRQLCDTAS
jgi:hypothetical protein